MSVNSLVLQKEVRHNYIPKLAEIDDLDNRFTSTPEINALYNRFTSTPPINFMKNKASHLTWNHQLLTTNIMYSTRKLRRSHVSSPSIFFL